MFWPLLMDFVPWRYLQLTVNMSIIRQCLDDEIQWLRYVTNITPLSLAN